MTSDLSGREHRGYEPAWYADSREAFIAAESDAITGKLIQRAGEEGIDPGPDQHDEWRQSVNLLQRPLEDIELRGQVEERLQIVRETVAAISAIRDVILEFDFRRRGLRMDCLLLAEGALFVVEFKRSKLSAADRDQVMNYAINLIEFHRETREWLKEGAILVPVLVMTGGRHAEPAELPPPAPDPWMALISRPMCCGGAEGLRRAIQLALDARTGRAIRTRALWMQSPFAPSSTIIDAALSLYGQHDVAAIEAHAAPKHAIDENTAEITATIAQCLAAGEHRIIFLSGAPGAGKTLVGLDLAFHQPYAAQTVFVTGNAPLVEVLQAALKSSYRTNGKGGLAKALAGYPKIGFKPLLAAATFKIVKAHQFLGERGKQHGQEDGRVLVFDEAQRTYEKGRRVLRQQLTDHEADLILAAQRKQFPEGSVVVALIGHNQAINRGEQGMLAWFEAAERQGWKFSVGDDTLELLPAAAAAIWRANSRRQPLRLGHLRQSMRFYRNESIERWVSEVLEGTAQRAANIASQLDGQGATVWMTRDLASARHWAKANALGGQRCGLIASGQARRLAAHGLFVDLKPDIATWMLAPTSDYRASSALELVQNQYQVQGLELDYTIVCWDLDLRRDSGRWAAFKMSGEQWKADREVEVARNSYRVLLTRTRKGMLIFVPPGDASGEDETRPTTHYDAIADHLASCGVRPLGT